ncbi:MAG: ATPase domain-containing protein, partial [Thermoprotei archaeon]
MSENRLDRGFKNVLNQYGVDFLFNRITKKGGLIQRIGSADAYSTTSGISEEEFILLRELAKLEKNVKINASRRRRAKLTTGVQSLDALLEGGVETGKIVQVVGEPGSGKTQLLMQLCVTAQLGKQSGGLGSGVLYLDFKGDIDVNRVSAVLKRFGVDESGLDAVSYACTFERDPEIFAEAVDSMRNTGKRVLLVDGGYLPYAFAGGRRAQFASNAEYTRLLIGLARPVRELGLAVVMAEPSVGFVPLP